MNFKDNFSRHAEIYARYRPQYPAQLFEFLSSLTSKRELAWDCGTGNGQCALGIAGFYDTVFASDPSEKQIQHAILSPKVKYKIERAEQTSLGDNSVDLITIAQALHWLNTEEFFNEAKRVLKKDGVIAVISYVNPVVSKEVDELTDQFHDQALKGYWLPENKLVFEKYRSIPFPFIPIKAPEFTIERPLEFSGFIGHLRTWSAVQRFIDNNKTNPLAWYEQKLKQYWKSGEIKNVSWKLDLKIGRNITG
jgi:SAM-dependent methyltransferase